MKRQEKENTKPDVRKGFVTSFNDKYNQPIKEGDIIREVIFQYKEDVSFEQRYDGMGNPSIVRVVDRRFKVKGWCLRIIEWDKDCLIAKSIKNSRNISTSERHYLNSTFLGVNGDKDVEVIGSIYDGWTIECFESCTILR